MAMHRFVCDACGTDVFDYSTKGVHVCPQCGTDMYWDLHGIGISDGDYNFASQALAMNPSQIAAHKKLFPDVEVTPDGCPEFKSVRQHTRYLEKVGMEKVTQKSKKPRNAKRIA